ncbi:hypothetical protein [Micromonospora violae]|uniref:hypothetical protein n=1 Tax=Micromonospora violae TaxID=1278207 RepID=UPI00102C6D05|nr:hypothetical protein [Micromonospora violae]
MASTLITVGVALVAAGVPVPVSAADGKPRGGGKPCPAERVLAQPPFPPTNVDLFTPETYAQASPMVPAPPRRITEAQLRVQLAKALSPRAKRHPGVVARGLAVFDDRKIKKIIPDPNLRAALASLVGGPSEVSVETIRSGVYTEVVFAKLPGNNTAEVRPPGPRILFNERFRFENFSLLGGVLAHETLHQDPAISAMEEYIGAALDSGYYGQVLLEQPKLGVSGTELTRMYNTRVLALLNTRDAKGRQSLTANPGNVFPGGKPLANFRSLFPANLGPATPGNPTLNAFLSAMTKTRQRNANFDQATADLLDVRLLWAPPEGRLRVAKLLQLKLPKGCPPWPQPTVPTQIPAGDQPAEATTAASPAERPAASGPASPLAASATVLSLLALLRLRRRQPASSEPRRLP